MCEEKSNSDISEHTQMRKDTPKERRARHMKDRIAQEAMALNAITFTPSSSNAKQPGAGQPAKPNYAHAMVAQVEDLNKHSIATLGSLYRLPINTHTHKGISKKERKNKIKALKRLKYDLLQTPVISEMLFILSHGNDQHAMELNITATLNCLTQALVDSSPAITPKEPASTDHENALDRLHKKCEDFKDACNDLLTASCL